MKTQDIGKAVRTISLLFSLVAPALVQAAAATAAPDAETPEEIIVTGQQSLTQLQVRIELAQDRMFGLFNELNDDDRYDIRCFEDQRTGTRISHRVCQPEFLRKSIELNAKAYLSGLQGTAAEGGGSIGGTAVHSVTPQAEIEYRYPILKEKMNALMEQNAEFAESIVEHYELLEEMRRRTSSSSDE